MTRHLRSLLDLSPAETTRVIDLAAEIKADPASCAGALAGKSIAMIFAKQSTRTRISFEVGIHQLGGQALALSSGGGTGMQMGRGESVSDTAKVLSRYVDAIVIRTFGQDQVDELAEHGSVPIVNALTDLYHPCQALADLLTIREHHQKTQGKRLVWVGAGNNVAHSLLLAGPRAGMDVCCCCPPSLPPNAFVYERARTEAAAAGTRVELCSDPVDAVAGADVIYADTWVSMGEEEESARLLRELAPYQVNYALMRAAGDQARFMHCLPAHRGEEVTDAVMDSPQSIVFDQAENRLHAQKALLLLLLGARPWT
ncbi:ornithine carbamoyltransferase [Pseudenhygromyxa sp. WMMC2535]|uniref:ornithine carbamoyltransferase n=1 Tax=Pseudenhygromyxa sp. WMMC2535 TaxID=2712867 RepID=UPI001554BEC7|nr:ornithine carbamoyltransferase [Pseudenhygromyxa sp. WMMC2535]NVB41194.1 ornithine carbamoyltransferase [Pseudenhygromyxa sp. WMMC2535]